MEQWKLFIFNSLSERKGSQDATFGNCQARIVERTSRIPAIARIAGHEAERTFRRASARDSSGLDAGAQHINPTGEFCCRTALIAGKGQFDKLQNLLRVELNCPSMSQKSSCSTSRLNRTTSGKEDTFVLDFVNEPDEIYAAFKPYYEVTPPGEATDPHHLYDHYHKIEEWRLFDQHDVDAFCNVWFRPRPETIASEYQELNSIIDKSVERFKVLDDEAQELSKSNLESYRRLYAFLAQVIPYQDTSLKKFYVYVRFLLKKLPRRDDGGRFDLEDEVALQYYRLQKVSEGAIDLADGEADRSRGLPKSVLRHRKKIRFRFRRSSTGSTRGLAPNLPRLADFSSSR